MGTFNDITDRSNGETIEQGWFNGIKTALTTVFGTSTSTAIELTSSTFIYFGDSETDGSWRLGVDGSALTIEKRVSSAWVKSQDFEVV